MTQEVVEPYIWGYIITLNLMLTWYATPLKVHFLQLWLKIKKNNIKVFTLDEFDSYVGSNWGLLGELLICPICLSHWAGAAVSVIFIYALEAPLFLAPLCMFTYPALVYWALKKLIY